MDLLTFGINVIVKVIAEVIVKTLSPAIIRPV